MYNLTNLHPCVSTLSVATCRTCPFPTLFNYSTLLTHTESCAHFFAFAKHTTQQGIYYAFFFVVVNSKKLSSFRRVQIDQSLPPSAPPFFVSGLFNTIFIFSNVPQILPYCQVMSNHLSSHQHNC